MSTLIRSLETTAGFLERRPIQFVPGLNCIIGARGTCKSTVVETLRFAFRQDPERDRYIQVAPDEMVGAPEDLSDLPGRGIISATLSPGSARVRLAVNGDPFTIERDTIPAGNLRVFKNDSVPWSETVGIVQQAEIYSQGELYLVAKDPKRRLALVDRPNAAHIKQLREENSKLLLGIVEKGKELRVVRGELTRRRGSTSQLPALRTALSQLQKNAPAPNDKLQAEHEEFLVRERLRERTDGALQHAERGLAALLEAAQRPSDYSDLIRSLEALGVPEGSEVARFLRGTSDLFLRAEREATDLASRAPSIDALREKFNAMSITYFGLLNEAQEQQEVLKREASYREEIARYEVLVEEAKRFEETVQKLLAERDNLRAQAKATRGKMLELRSAEIERINARFHSRILLSLQPPTELPAYRQELRRLMQGSGMRDQDQIAAEVARLFSPEQLIRIVEDQDAKHMADLLDRDLAQVNRLLAHLAEHQDLYGLEAITTDDVLEITLYDKGKPKGMNELSKGQMATALLPLILRDDECPLVIDQPEDDLDNSFIFDTLVKLVLELKTRRQLIFVTHNANLPVLGEADQVLVMEMEGPTHAGLPTSGTVDQQRDPILRLLEGGEEAFRARADRYARK